MKNSSISTILLAIGIICLAFAGIKTNRQLNEIEKKLDNIASETDATSDRINIIESDFKNYRTGTKEVIDNIYQQLQDLKNNTQDEIDRIDDDVEQIRISKAKKKQTYTASRNIYPANTDGLTQSSGVNYFGEQKETYYNLNMSRVVSNAQNSGLEGDYWVREDGAKMFGDYVIVAANQDVHPYGSTIETSMGTGIVLDTGGFAAGNPTQVDIATDW